jgi:hypothetical protein
MQIICLLALILMNGAYLFVSYNMDEMVVDESEPAIEEVVTMLRPSMNLELVDILDLDIFDVDVEELAASSKHNSSISDNFHRIEDAEKRH